MDTIATKFSNWEVPELKDLKDSRAYELRTKLNSGSNLTREEKDWITDRVNNNSFFKSAIPLMGWKFDFSDILKTYLVKQHGVWSQYNSTDKSALRKLLFGRIEIIKEL